MGFGTTQKTYLISKRKAETQEYNLNYKRHKPMSKLKTSNEMINDIINHMKEY